MTSSTRAVDSAHVSIDRARLSNDDEGTSATTAPSRLASNLRDWSQSVDQRLRAFFSQPIAVFGALLILVLAAHGYEIFSLHLTIDEEVHVGLKDVASKWISQGRWGMAWLSALLPSSVVPVVSTALGVGLLCASLWHLLVHVLAVDRHAAVVSVGVAMTLPTLPFTLSFATLAYGFGFASAAAVGFMVSLRARRNDALALGIVTGAFAVSVYQPMVFALAALAALEMLRPGVPLIHPGRLRAPLALIGSVLLYFAVDELVRSVFGAELRYVSQFVDVGGLLSDPLARIGRAARSVYVLATIKDDVFSLHTHWLAVFLTAALLLSFKPAARKEPARFAPALTTASLVALPLAAEAVSTYGVPVRSGVYFPFIVSLIASVAFASAQAPGRLVLTGLAILAVIGNTVVDNRLYGAAAFAYERDRAFAQELSREIDQVTRDAPSRPVPLEVVGMKAWPESPLIPKRETLGASFFEWDEGNRCRVAGLLSSFGTEVRSASPQEAASIVPVGSVMPSWPAKGSIRLERGIVIVKLGQYTPSQERVLSSGEQPEICH